MPGRARPNNYHGGHSIAIVVDRGGGDDRYGEQPPGKWNDRVSWKQDVAYVLDLPREPGDLASYVRRATDAPKDGGQSDGKGSDIGGDDKKKKDGK